MTDPSAAEAALYRIQELVRLGQFEAAESACQSLVAEAPEIEQAWGILGLLALERGDPAEAQAALRQATKLAPGRAVFWQQLGSALAIQGKPREAAEAFRRAVALDPADATAWRNLGAAEQQLDRLAEAKAAFERSLALAPDDPLTLGSYALLAALCGLPREAVTICRGALAQHPGVPLAWFALGNAHLLMGELPEAESALHRALELSPQDRAVLHNLAIVQEQRSMLADAERSAAQLVAIHPWDGEAWALLGRIQRARIKPRESLASLRRAVELAPGPESHSKLLVGMQYDDGASPEELLAAHRQWDAAYARPLLPVSPPPVVRRDPTRPLRLGFVSADFGRHPAGFMVLPGLEHLDKSQCSLACYCDRAAEDEYTARFRAAADLWRTTSGIADEDLAEQIRQDEVDILIDLMGHFGRRMLVFARKPAPVQATWFGYVGTTGLSAIDFLLTDRFRVHEDEEAALQETVLRLPHDNCCYQPPADAPAAGPLPALAAGHVTFGSFNNPAKFSPSTLDAWAAVLRRVPASRLLLNYAGLDDTDVQDRLRAHFGERGVAAERIELEGRVPHAKLLANYHRVDLALDTQPFSGDLTTCEALWMGVPVVTCPGRPVAGRHSVSHLNNAGCPQFVAADTAGFVELAARWAGRLDELAVIRAGLREQVRRSPLCNAPQFARDLLSALQDAWLRKASVSGQ
jgi:protein O-GlcNAc transferase